MRRLVTVATVLCCFVLSAAESVGAETKFTSGDAGPHDQFGEEMAADGEHLIIGASRYPERGGAAYVYTWDGSAWGSEVRLRAHDHSKNDFFGSDVDIDGDHALVGARWHDPHDRALRNHKYGAAYFYRHSADGWKQESFVQASDRQLNREFGGAVGVSGEHAVIAAKFSEVDGRANQGKAYVFRYKDGGWTQSQTVVAPDGGVSDHFGESVDIDGDYIFVGGPGHRGGQYDHAIGAVWVFKRDSDDKWKLETKLAPADLEDGNAFGSSIHIADDVAIVGAPLAGGNESGSGTAYIFRRSGGSWKKEARLMVRGGRQGDDFGHRVWIGGELAVVGAWLTGYGDDLQKGAAYVFKKTSTGWTESTKLTASDGGYEDQFGSSVAVGAGQIVVGASGDGTEDAYLRGAVYVYGGLVDP